MFDLVFSLQTIHNLMHIQDYKNVFILHLHIFILENFELILL